MELEGEEVKLQFLVSGSYDALPSSYLKLRSYLNIHSSNLANLHGLKLPKCFTKKNLTCTQCFLPWSCETCSIKLLPVKKHKKSFSKTKMNSGLKVPKNHLVLKCKICNCNSHFYFPKIEKTVKVVPQDKKKEERKKKKKKKDKMLGLCKSLNTSVKNLESSIGNINETKSSTSNPSKSAKQTPNSSRNVKEVNLKIQNSQSVPQLQVKKIKQPIRNRNLGINQRSCKLQHKASVKKNKNLQKLKKLVQEQRQPIKKTLKDFLTLI